MLHGEEIQVELFLQQLCEECLEWHMPPTTSRPAQHAITQTVYNDITQWDFGLDQTDYPNDKFTD